MKARRSLPSVDLRALQAAARVAGLVGLTACAGRERTQPASASEELVGPAPLAEVPPSGEAEDPEAMEPLDPVAQCRDATREAFLQEGTLGSGVVEAEVKACCQMIAEAMDEAMRSPPRPDAPVPPPWETRNECCSLLDWRGSMACTPWGPPAPAAFDAADRRRREDAWEIDWRDAVASEVRALGGTEDPELRALARETWRGRMVNETVSSRVFTALAHQLEAGGFGREEVERWASFAEEERRHGQLCGQVVEALGGAALARSTELQSVPRHADVDARQGALRNVLSVACLSETVAVALIGAEREDMREGPLRELLTEIYRDEVGHARAGWRLLERVLRTQPERKADLSRYLPVALEEMIRFELEHLPLSGPAQAAASRWPQGSKRWGLCSGQRARRLLFATVEEVLAPRLDQLLA